MATTKPFAYNTGPTIGGTNQLGDLAIGYADVEYSANYGGVEWWMGPDEDLGYVIAVPVSGNTQPSPISGVTASVGFYGTEMMANPFSEASFLQLVNQTFNQNFINGTNASTWLTNNGYWNSWVGQSLYLDSGNPSSYPGSGITWYDIDNNNNGTLQNGVTYSPSYSGILEFNSSNSQYVSFSSPQDIPTGNSQYTINTWFRANSSGTLGIIGWGNWGAYNQVNALRLGNNLLINYWWGNDMVVPYNYNIGQWYNLCVTFDGVYRTMYLDGTQVGQDSPGLPNVGSSSNMQVGTTNGSEYFNGSIPIVGVYSYALTSGEVLSNYNSTYPRFIEPTPTPTVTPTNTATPTNTVTPTNTITPTNTVTPSITPTNTTTPTNTVTPTNTITPTNTVTPTNTITPTNTVTPTNTQTPSVTPTKTVTPTTTVTPTITPSNTPNLQGFNYTNFASTAGLTAVGNAAVTSNIYYLTTNANNQVGNVYRTTAIQYNRNFSAQWEFIIGGGTGADGYCVQWTTTNNTNGVTGGGVGRISASSTINAISFTTYPSVQNVTWYKSNVSQGTQAYTSTFRQTLYYWLDYNHASSTASVYISTTSTKPGSAAFTYSSFSFDTTSYYMGFGAATGGANDNHELVNWKLTFT